MSKLLIKREDYWNNLPNLILKSPDGDFKSSRDGTSRTVILYEKDMDAIGYPWKEIHKSHKERFDSEDSIFFYSLWEGDGMNMHKDAEDVLIECLYGEVDYHFECGKVIKLKEGETLYFKEGVSHWGKTLKTPRICISSKITREIKKEEVTYHYHYL